MQETGARLPTGCRIDPCSGKSRTVAIIEWMRCMQLLPAPRVGPERRLRYRWAGWGRRLTILMCVMVGAAMPMAGALTRGLPDLAAIRALDDPSRVTMLYDIDDRPLFSLFKEERV